MQKNCDYQLKAQQHPSKIIDEKQSIEMEAAMARVIKQHQLFTAASHSVAEEPWPGLQNNTSFSLQPHIPLRQQP
jgi:hypothetical protein